MNLEYFFLRIVYSTDNTYARHNYNICWLVIFWNLNFQCKSNTSQEKNISESTSLTTPHFLVKNFLNGSGRFTKMFKKNLKSEISKQNQKSCRPEKGSLGGLRATRWGKRATQWSAVLKRPRMNTVIGVNMNLLLIAFVALTFIKSLSAWNIYPLYVLDIDICLYCSSCW